ncbi:MAG TPA: serine/threonine-protein kinase [Polyangia bacterium]|jgi:serine/threonine-protein kinase|nr:serine/threonine-protein kinase [Polyangia bacterium]
MSVAQQLPGLAAEQELPKVFGRYLLLKRLSRGGMGEIFLAKLGEIQGFEKLVIIKKILPHLVADQEFIKRFIDEAQVAIKLQHANVAPVFEVGKVDGEYFLAIEYIEGRDLRRMITRQREERTRLPSDLAMFVVREMANGLAYAHRRTDESGRSLALVHCDISPPNVMVSFEGEVKIIDFGIAKSAIRIAETNPNMGFGKFGYMAPEQLVRGGIVDKRTDVYAAGVVLYELLTGERLFTFPEGADYRQIARMVTQGKFKQPSQRDPRLDPGLDPIVMKALASNKDERYQTAEEFRDAIQVKLSQMNPTINADALAHFMRGLFRDEITEEHALVASMKAVDVAPFQHELDQATHKHTVTFARASGISRIIARGAQPSGAIKVPTAEQLLAHPQRRGLFIAGTLAALVAGGAAAMLMARPSYVPPPTLASNPPAPPPATTPVVTPLETPPPTILPTPTRDVLPARHAARHHEKVNKVVVASKPTPPPHALRARTPDQVQAKYRTVKGEYNAFKSQYGAVLEDKWNAIATEITFGKADKFDKVDAMLEALRREMAKVRAGG